MPREFKAQRIQRESEELAARQLEYARLYPERLMEALARATNHCFEITVTDGMFFVWNRNSVEGYNLPYSIQPTEQFKPLQDLEGELNHQDDVKREDDRLDGIRRGALNKLTSEEKEVLGV